MSIYKKIALFTAFLVCLCTLPLVAMTYRAIMEFNLEEAELDFANISEIFSNHISTAQFFFIHAEVSRITEQREDLRNAASAIKADLEKISTLQRLNREEMLSLAQKSAQAYGQRGIHVRISLPLGDAIANSSLVPGRDLAIQDLKGRTLSSLLENLPPKGDFTLLEQPNPEGKRSFLAHFQQSTGSKGPFADAVIMTFSPMDDLEKLVLAHKKQIIESTQERFSLLAFPHVVTIALVDKDKKLLAYRGYENHKKDFLRLAQEHVLPGKGLNVMVNMNGEETFLLTRYVKTMDWHIVSSIPSRDLVANGHGLAQKLTLVALALLALAITLALICLHSMLAPLRQLSLKLGQFQRTAFNSPGAPALDTEMARGLPLQRKDEMGQVARAFVDMSRELSRQLQRLQIHKAAEERLQNEMHNAGALQKQMLPPPTATGPGWAIGCLLEPAQEIGGDFFDYFPLQGPYLAVVLGGVRGHGMAAALLMSRSITLTRHVLWQEATHNPTPRDCLKAAMENIHSSFADASGKLNNVRLFLAVYHTETGQLWHVGFGQYSPRVLDKEGVRLLCPEYPENLEHAAPAYSAAGETNTTVHEDKLEEGQVLFCHGPGLVDTLNAEGLRFGQERLDEILFARHTALPCDAQGLAKLCRSIRGAVESFNQGTMSCEDLSLLVLQRTAGDAPKPAMEKSR